MSKPNTSEGLISVYPGTFDPLTYGHLDVIERAAKLFSTVIIAAAESTSKNTVLDINERISVIEGSVKHITNCRVEKFSGLLVDFAKQKNASVLIRGLRAVSDFEYEFQLALMNRKLAEDISTVFLMPHEKYTYVNSSLIRNLAMLGQDVSDFVPSPVQDALRQKFSK